jgi:hypothetical protein
MSTDTDTDHKCHREGCNVPVAPRMFACKAHWFELPKALRAGVLRTYRPGQEQTKNPSRAYLNAAMACMRFWWSQDSLK